MVVRDSCRIIHGLGSLKDDIHWMRIIYVTLINDLIYLLPHVLYFISLVWLCRLLIQEGGIERLMHIVRSPVGIYSEKVVRYASQVLLFVQLSIVVLSSFRYI